MSYKEPVFMKELHEIREKHYEETKSLTKEERVARVRQEAAEFLREFNYKLVPTRRGTFKIVKVIKKAS